MHFWCFICFSISLSAAVAQENPEHSNKNKSGTHELIKHLLAQDLGTRTFPFPDVVHAATGKKVIAYHANNSAHQEMHEAIRQAANAAMLAMNAEASPVRKLRRINEASRFFEDHLRKSIQAHPAFTCSIPKNPLGREQRAGYPDLLVTHRAKDGTLTHAYLDPKLFEEKSRASSLRTFYYEPRPHTNKIQHDAVHFLLGFSHDGKEGAWQFTGWDLCDLSRFHVRLKAEFQASNRNIYRPNTIIGSSKKQP